MGVDALLDRSYSGVEHPDFNESFHEGRLSFASLSRLDEQLKEIAGGKKFHEI